MSSSQNGWTVDAAGSQQDRTAVAGVTFPNGVRRGDVATVLFYVARRFHAEVEPLKAGTCWGWFNRPIRGATSISNHASGTAIDLNADKHPLGKVGTFSAAKVRAIRRILADCDGVVRWGGDYSGRKDEMHFEINVSSSRVAELAKKINQQEDDMAITPAEMKAIASEVWNADLGRTNRVSTGVLLQNAAAGTAVMAAIKDGQVDVTELAAALAPAIIAGLPDGTLTQDDVEQAVRDVLRTGTDAS